jgi:hypothetical protein
LSQRNKFQIEGINKAGKGDEKAALFAACSGTL